MGYTLNKHGLFNERWAWTNSNIKRVLLELETCKHPIVHVCSGCSNIGDIRVDRVNVNTIGMVKHWSKDSHKHRGSANILGNMAQLPLKSGFAETVLCDPPYDIKPMDHDVFKDLNRELIRILKPKGKLIYIAPWIPASSLLSIQKIIPIPIGDNYNNVFYKIMSVSFKSNGQLGDYLNGCAELTEPR